MSTATTQTRRVSKIVAAIASRTWLDTVYEAVDRETGEMVASSRSILPFRVYKSREGYTVVDGYDTYRQSVRTFRVDRFKRMSTGEKLEGADPSVLQTRGGEVPVYPANWRLVQANPQTVSQKALDKFLAAGWSLTPYQGVIEPEQVA